MEHAIAMRVLSILWSIFKAYVSFIRLLWGILSYDAIMPHSSHQ